MVADEGPLLPVFLEVLVADVLPVTDDDDHRVQLRPLRLQCEVFRELQDVRRARFDATVGGLVLDETFVLFLRRSRWRGLRERLAARPRPETVGSPSPRARNGLLSRRFVRQCASGSRPRRW